MTTKFKVGDTVRIKDEAIDFPGSGLKCGTVHKIVGLSSTGRGAFLPCRGAKAPWNDHVNTRYFYDEELERASKFRVGDKVFVTQTGGFSFNDRVANRIPGTVREVSPKNVKVRFDADIYGEGCIDSTDWNYSPADLRLASEEPGVPPLVVNKAGFKIGDKVRILRCMYPDTPGFAKGTETTVVNIYEHGVMLPCEGTTAPYLDHCNCLFHNNQGIELVTQPKTQPKTLPFNAVVNAAPKPVAPPPESVTLTLSREDMLRLTRLIGAVCVADGDRAATGDKYTNWIFPTWEKFRDVALALDYTRDDLNSSVALHRY